jgi:hypothetical protein
MNDQGIRYGGIGEAVFFKCLQTTDVPLGIIFRGMNSNNTSGGTPPVDVICTQGIRVSVTRTGVISFESIVPNGTATYTWPTLQATQAIANGQEYCLEVTRISAGNGLGYAVRLSTATNGVRTTLLAAGSFINNLGVSEGMNVVQLGGFYNGTNGMATMTRFESYVRNGEGFSAPLVNPISALPAATKLVGLSGITETTNNSISSYTGTGVSLANAPSGQFAGQFNSGTDFVAAIKITSTTTQTYLGIGLSANSSRPLTKALEKLYFAIQISQPGDFYKVMIDGRYRACPRNIIITDGDIVMLRNAGGSLFADVSHDNGATWTRIFTWYAYTQGMSSYVLAEVILPGTSTIAAVYS